MNGVAHKSENRAPMCGERSVRCETDVEVLTDDAVVNVSLLV